jgi:hypothetical protein
MTPQGFAIESVSLAGAEDLSLFFRESLIDTPLVTQLGFEVLNMAKNSGKIYLHDRIGKSMRQAIGCGWQTTGEGANIYAKDVEMKEMEIALEQCYSVFEQTFLAQNLRFGNDRADVLGTEIGRIIDELLTTNLVQETLRTLFLSDKALVGNPFYNAIDGLFKSLLVGTINGDGVVNVGAITDNDLSVANVTGTLFKFVQNQNRDLKQVRDNDKVFIVSPNVYDAYKFFLQNNANLESSKVELINGIETLRFNGSQVIANHNALDFLQSDFLTGSPLEPKCKNFVIYTKPSSHKLLLDITNASFDAWYEKKEKKNYFRTNFRMGYSYDYGTLSVIGGIESL